VCLSHVWLLLRLLSKIPESKIVASRCTNPAKHGKISV
jgi:hypothetical protein